MAYQSEAALEQQFIEQLNKQEYSTVDIPDYDALVENFKVQFEAFNAPKLDTPITDKEWERIFNLMLGKSVFQSAKILRDKFVLEREDGTKVYLSFFDQDHTKNIFQVTHQPRRAFPEESGRPGRSSGRCRSCRSPDTFSLGWARPGWIPPGCRPPAGRPEAFP